MAGPGIFLVISVLFVLVFVAACTGQPRVIENETPAPAIVIDYRKTGGIAGTDDHLVIFKNGQGIYSRRSGHGEFSLNEKEMDSLSRLLELTDFPNLSDRYPAPAQGADYFTYIISSHGKTVWTETGGIPDALDQVINLMDSYLADRNT